jgi:hypothetical protein
MNLALIAAIVAFAIAAILAFLVDTVATRDVIGIIAIGLALFAAHPFAAPRVR